MPRLAATFCSQPKFSLVPSQLAIVAGKSSRLEAKIGGEWRVIHNEVGNYQRRRVHRWAEPLPTVAALRLVVTATNGLDHARVCEVRVYS